MHFLNKISRLYNIVIQVYEYKNRKIQLYESSAPINISGNEKKFAILKINFSYYLIKNFSALVKNYVCPNCYQKFSKINYPHLCKNKFGEPELIHKPRIYRPRKTMVQELQSIGINIPDNTKTLKYYATFDIETYTEALRNQKSAYMEEIGIQKLANICIASNVPGHRYKVFWNKDDNNSHTVEEFIKYALQISDKAAEYHMKINSHILEKGYKIYESAAEKGKNSYAKYVQSVLNRFKEYITKLRVFGYNSSRYDLKILNGEGFLHYLQQFEGSVSAFRDPSPNTYLTISTKRLKFMDLIRYLGAPTTLSNALKNFKVNETDLHELYNDENISIEKCIESGLKLLFPYASAKSYEAIHK